MEDAHTSVLDLIGGGDGKTNPDERISFFGVFDGHGGDKVAIFAGENIHNIVAKQDTFKSGDYAQGLKDGFLATDRAILNGITFFFANTLVFPLLCLRDPSFSLLIRSLVLQILSMRKKSPAVPLVLV